MRFVMSRLSSQHNFADQNCLCVSFSHSFCIKYICVSTTAKYKIENTELYIRFIAYLLALTRKRKREGISWNSYLLFFIFFFFICRLLQENEVNWNLYAWFVCFRYLLMFVNCEQQQQQIFRHQDNVEL